VYDSRTEAEMANAFERWLRKSASTPSIGPFDRVFREVIAGQGIADFVGIRTDEWHRLKRKLPGMVLSECPLVAAHVIAALSKRSLTKGDLVDQIPFSARAVKSTLSALISKKAIALYQDRYVLKKNVHLRTTKIVTFELKLDNWKRALFQALQTKAYSGKAYCVFPPEREGTVVKNEAAFKAMNVGVLIFDAEGMKVKHLIRAQQERCRPTPQLLSTLTQLAKR
jgi:hypothetical protein